jgi:hypothetical protein
LSLRLALAGIHIPRSVRNRRFRDLVALTAAAFGSPAPVWLGSRFGAALDGYAKWTREQADRISPDPGLESRVKARLGELAAEFGRGLRKDLGVKTRADVMRAGRLLYGLLRIDFRGDPQGGITISRCFFSEYYNPRTCAIVAALDEGILAGLAGGGALRFRRRITEGEDACRARFEFSGGPR